jgi:hypothetical protein
MHGVLETLSVGTPEEVVDPLLVPIADAAVLAILEGKVCWQYRGHAALALRLSAHLAARDAVFDQPLFPDVYGFTSIGPCMLSA